MMTKRKILTRVAVAAFIILVLCTMLSKSIYLAMLPQVETAKISNGSVTDSLSYTGTFDFTDKTTVTAKAEWNFTEVNISAGKEFLAGDVLAKVDMTDFDLSRRQMEMNLSALKAQLKNTYGEEAKASVQLSLDMAQRSYDKFMATYPQNGVITAPYDGSVLSCSVKAGDTAWNGNTVLELKSLESKPIVRWSASYKEGEAFVEGSDVTLYFQALKQGSLENFTVKSQIDTKLYNAETGGWDFEITLTGFKNEIPLNAVASIMLTRNLANGTVVPSAALAKTGLDKATVYTVRTRQGVFGEEDYVTATEVKVVADNGYQAVIEMSGVGSDDRVVTYASKSLTDDATVVTK